MAAVFRKELHTYAVTMIGAAALAVLLALTGFVTRYINCYNGYGSYSYTLQYLAFWFYAIAMPLLTMRTFSEEYRQKTDQLLFTAPVRVRAIVYGKYAALLVMLFIPVLLMKLYAAALGRYGSMPAAQDNAALFLFFLMGAAYFAVGMLISSVTENQIISAVICILFVIFTQLVGNVRTIIGAGRGSAFLFVLLLIVLGGILLYAATKRLFLSAVIFLTAMIAAVLLFMLRGNWFDGRVSRVISLFDFRSAFFTGVMGTMDFRAILYFLSFAAACTELTVYSVTRRMRPASSAESLLIPVMLLNLLLLNLIVGKIPSALTVRDLTAQQLYTVGESTREKAKELTEDVTFYYLTSYGEEDRDLTALLRTYEGLSEHIAVEKIDLAVSPRFPEAYGETSLPNNSVVAVAKDRFKVLRYEVFYPSDGENTYATAFDGEGQLTSAMEYVTDDRQVTLYLTEGHGEPAFDAAMADAVSKMNILTEPLNLLSAEIPEENSAVAVFAPSTDFTEEETAKLRDYLMNGGSVLYVGLMTGGKTPVLDAFLEEFGIAALPGYVMEQADANYVQLPYLLLPVIAESPGITYAFPQENVLCPYAQAFLLKEGENTAAVPLLLSSESSYVRSDLSITENAPAENEEKGPFALAAAVYVFGETEAENTAENAEAGKNEAGTEPGKLVCYSTPCIFSRSIFGQFLQADMSLPSGNAELFARTAAFLTEQDAGQAIPAKSMTVPQLLLPQGVSVRFGVLSMAVLPGAVLAAGLIVWLRRRRR